jgi:hypothetical protein
MRKCWRLISADRFESESNFVSFQPGGRRPGPTSTRKSVGAENLLSQLAFCSIASLLAVAIICARPAAVRAQEQTPCAHSHLPTDPGTEYRPGVASDYLVIEYNAGSLQTFWYDYHNHFSSHNFIPQNGSFLPVVYTKEKIAVHVCNLHFTDQLTVTTSPFAVPEGGADIRGVSAPVTPLATLSSALDVLQSQTTTGSAAPESGLGFGAPAAVSLAAVTGITPGTLSFSYDKSDPTKVKITNTYTAATVTVSGKQVALLMHTLKRSVDAMRRNIDNIWNPADIRYPLNVASPQGPPPGSVHYLFNEAEALEHNIEERAMTAPNNPAGFDESLTQVQNYSSELSALASQLSTQGFGAGASTLQNNYATLRGILDFVAQGTHPTTCIPVAREAGAPDAAAPKKLTPAEIAALTPDKIATLTDEQYGSLTNADIVKKSKTKDMKNAWQERRDKYDSDMQINMTDPDLPHCSQFEAQKFAEFNNAYQAELNELAATDHTTFSDGPPVDVEGFNVGVEGSRINLFNSLRELREALQSLDGETGSIFTAMNEWYKISRVEETDLIAPSTSNALMRISIIVQRGYTPFTLASSPTPAGGAAISTAAPAPSSSASASAPAASTSTPAHAVKTILVEVHRVANFNLAGGAVLIHVPNTSYSIEPSLTPSTGVTNTTTGVTTYTGTCNGQTVNVPFPPGAPTSGSTTPTPPTYSCIVPTQQSEWQVAGMVGITWYPWGRDYFPRHSGFSNPARNFLPSLLMATSVTSLGNAVGAVNWEPLSGIDIFAGIGSANKSALPSGFSPTTTAVPQGYALQTNTQLHAGFAIGVGFDLSVFTQLFGKSSSSTPATAASTP